MCEGNLFTASNRVKSKNAKKRPILGNYLN